MGILDKLRPQAKWKHGDPAVRLEAVQALDDAEGDVLIQVATDDLDARVRRAAVARLSDPDTLAAVSRNDAETGVRDAAVERLAALAASSGDVSGARRCRARRPRRAPASWPRWPVPRRPKRPGTLPSRS